MRFWLTLALSAAGLAAADVRNATVYSEPGRFGGWPANHGIWSWGNEILTGFSAAWFQPTSEDRHPMDRSKGEEPRLARSLDGGLTWTIETPRDLLAPSQGGRQPVDLTEPIDFTHPDFAMTLRLTDVNAGPSRLWYSLDRGHTWRGPFKFPLFGQKGVAARTDYLVNGRRDCLVFLTASKSNGREGRPFCARTTDGGLSWRFVSWIGPEPAGFSIMPSSVRLPYGRILTVIRRREAAGTWTETWASDDDGATWKAMPRAAESNGGHSGNPSQLIRLGDGRLSVTYGYRDKPYGIRARLSGDGGRTWSPEILLRADGTSWDLGYPRSVQRPDGKIVTVYYFNPRAGRERTIEATIWDPGERPPHAITLDDLLGAREVDEARISPDGSRIAFAVSSTDLAANRSGSRLWFWEQGKLREVSGAPEGPANLRWSPDGRRLAFIARNAVWTLDAATAASARVCNYDRGNSFLSKAGNWLAWSPDGTRLAFAGTLEPRPPAGDPAVVNRILYKARTSLSDNRRSHVFVVDAGGGEPRAVTPGDYDEHSIDWGGNEIVFLSNRGPNPDAVHNYDLFAVNPATGAVRRLTETPGVEMNPRVSPDGKWIAYTATTRPLTTIDSVAEDAHVWVIPFAGGAAREINHDLDRRSGAPEWTWDSAAVLYTAGDRGRTPLMKTALSGSTSRVIERDAQVSSFSVSRDGSIAFTASDPLHPRELMMLHGPATDRLTRFNDAFVSGLKLVKPETLHFRSSDGTQIEGWLYPPAGRSGRIPMILSIHGGPHGMFGYAWNSRFQLNAAHGYATLAVNPRGSSGYGQKFSDGCVNNWGGGDYQDLMAGVDEALRNHPEIDPERLAVTGGSYGGFMTNWVVTQTARFKAAVASASLSNLVSFYATSLYQDLVHTEFGGFPWDDDHFALLWRWSPLAHVRNVRTPVLFLHGENDNDVHITQAEEMYTALKYRGVDAELVRYPREGHGFREPRHQTDSARRALEWIERYTGRKE